MADSEKALLEQLAESADVKGVASRILMELARADELGALNGLKLAVAAYFCSPDTDKDNAVSLSVSFGEIVTREIQGEWGKLQRAHLRSLEAVAYEETDFSEVTG